MTTATSTDQTLVNTTRHVVKQQEALDGVIKAVRNFHHIGRFGVGHQGAFEYCTEEPCLGVLKAYPDAVPADRRPDWIEGAKSLDRHN